MELRHLHYFLAVAEELNFTRAAQRLHIAQPPLSVQIRQLEEEIGVPLFTRTKRRVELTPAGEVFLSQTRRILGMVEIGIRMARDTGLGKRGTLRLGSVYSAIYAVVPAMLRLLGREYPDISVELAELTVQQQIDALIRGEIDVGILRSPINEESLATHLLFRERIVGLVPRDHPLAARGQVSLAQLAEYPFILSGIGLQSSFRQHVLGLYERLGIPLNIAREVAEIHSIISLVGAGLGVSIAPTTVSRIRVDEVVYLEIEDDTPTIEVSLAWLKDVRPPALLSLLELMDGPDMQAMLATLDQSDRRTIAGNRD